MHKHNHVKLTAGVAFVMSALLVAPSAYSQVRGGVTISSPGSMQTPGDASGSRSFRTYSYGLGSLGQPSAAPGENVLGSSISGNPSYSVGRGGIQGVGTSDSLSNLTASPSALVRYNTNMPSFSLDSSGGYSSGGNYGKSGESIALAASAYMNAIRSSASLLTTEQGRPIDSLVPAKDSQYAQHMRRADHAFRQGSYSEAYNEYQLAYDVTAQSPDSMVALAQASFAVSNGAYARAGYYLKRAFQTFDSLAEVPLRPRDFYGNLGDYSEQVAALERYVRENPQDGNAQLVLAYFHWFVPEPDVKDVQAALTLADAAARKNVDEQLRIAVDAFRQGIARSLQERSDATDKSPTQPATAPSS